VAEAMRCASGTNAHSLTCRRHFSSSVGVATSDTATDAPTLPTIWSCTVSLDPAAAQAAGAVGGSDWGGLPQAGSCAMRCRHMRGS
jgi:hypothetical protein